MIKTNDGGFILAGTSFLNPPPQGNLRKELYILRLDSNGDLIWENKIGGSEHENISNIKELENGEILITGSTDSNDGDVSFNHGGNDFWMLRLNSSGEVIWDKTFGGTSDDNLHVTMFEDDGIVMTGRTYSQNGDLDANNKKGIWLLKTTYDGDIVWQKAYGGTSPYGLDKTEDGYIISSVLPGWDTDYILIKVVEKDFMSEETKLNLDVCSITESNKFTISTIFNDVFLNAKLDVYNVAGQLIKNIPVELIFGENTITVNMGDHANGIYYGVMTSPEDKNFISNVITITVVN